MSTMVPMYGFGGGSGGTGAALTVTAPAGATVTVSKDGTSKTKVADSAGVAVFKGLATGTWTVTITDGEQEVQKTVAVTADYFTEITFFAATIHVTYPAGFTCTATDGTTTLTAPDTSGTWDCVVPNAGTWTVFAELSAGMQKAKIEISENGKTENVDLSGFIIYKYGEYGPLGELVTYDNKCNEYLTKLENGVLRFSVEVQSGGASYPGGAAYAPEQIDLTNYSTMIAKLQYSTATSYRENGLSFGVRKNTPNNGSDTAAFMFDTIKTVKSTDLNTYTLDISGLSGYYWVGVICQSPGKTTQFVDIHTIQLVP